MIPPQNTPNTTNIIEPSREQRRIDININSTSNNSNLIVRSVETAHSFDHTITDCCQFNLPNINKTQSVIESPPSNTTPPVQVLETTPPLQEISSIELPNVNVNGQSFVQLKDRSVLSSVNSPLVLL